MRGIALLFVLLLATTLGSALPARGQYPPDLGAGGRVRFQPETGGTTPVTARIVELHRDWFSFQPVGDSLVWSRRLESIDTILVSAGRNRSRSAWWGAALGVYLGSSATAIAGVLAARSIHRGVGESVALGALAGAAVGAPLGAGIGALLAPERWRVYLFTHPARE